MAFDRQANVVAGTRATAGTIDEAVTDLEAFQGRYDVLNIETPNFAAGFFGTAGEITSNDLLGVLNSFGALKTAAPTQWAAFRAALRKARS